MSVAGNASRNWAGTVLYYSAVLIVSVLALAVATRQYGHGFEVAIKSAGDVLFNSIPIRAVKDGEPLWRVTRLSAPFYFNQFLFWPGDTLAQAWACMAGLLMPSVGGGLLAAWYAKAGFAGVTAAWSLRQLGVHSAVAAAFGVLYATCPFALGNNTDMYNLSTHIQPIFCAMGLLLLRDEFHQLPSRKRVPYFLACAAAGLDDIYAAYFCCFLLCVAALLCLLRGTWRGGVQAVIGIALIALFTALNFAPAVLAQQANPEAAQWMKDQRKPSDVGETSAGPLRLNVMLAPVSNHLFKPLASVTEKMQQNLGVYRFGVDRTALGTLGTLGFAVIIAALLLAPLTSGVSERPHWLTLVAAAGGFVVACILLGTVDGLSGFATVYVTALLRTYMRLVAFIQFFCFFGLAVPITVFLRDRLAKGRRGTCRLALACLALLTVLGVLDQMGGLVTGRYRSWHARLHNEAKSLTTQVEATLPPGAMVYQFPDVERAVFEKYQMLPYEQLRPYLLTSGIRWSYAPLVRPDAVARWHRALNQNQGPDLLRALLLAGFDGVWIDRFGYADQGEAIVALFAAASMAKRLDSRDKADRYVFFDLRETRAKLEKEMLPEALKAARQHILEDPRIVPASATANPNE